MIQNEKLSAEEKLEQMKLRLRAKIEQTDNRLKQLRAKDSAKNKKKRNRALYNLAGIWAMVDEGKFLCTAESPLIFRLVLASALQLADLLTATDENSKITIAKMEQKAKEYLEKKPALANQKI